MVFIVAAVLTPSPGPVNPRSTGPRSVLYRSVEALQGFVDAVTRGDVPSNLDRAFTLDEIQEAHRFMEGDRAQSKLVVLL